MDQMTADQKKSKITNYKTLPPPLLAQMLINICSLGNMILMDKFFAVPSLLWFKSAFAHYVEKNIPGPVGDLF